jgi:hypothetical protein
MHGSSSWDARTNTCDWLLLENLRDDGTEGRLCFRFKGFDRITLEVASIHSGMRRQCRSTNCVGSVGWPTGIHTRNGGSSADDVIWLSVGSMRLTE